MRLDKFLSDMGVCSRTESKRAARAGNIAVNGISVRDTSVHIDPETDEVTYLGERVTYAEYTYIMMNKPDGVLSATEDGAGKTVLDLLPEKYAKMGLFPCGRLDKNTLGLLILTNDGKTAHDLLSPSKHVEKTYLFECETPLSDSDCDLLCRGVDIGEKRSTREATLALDSRTRGEITVVEGKFHQIKRMFAAVGNKITDLERISFGGIPLDKGLARGEWRELTAEEISLLRRTDKTT
ncbi:MAG: rRNA pseudouridine synthase [Clostridia bacterium]|nr:rRNA pseudouridine synthase [Clostridia bacterium]